MSGGAVEYVMGVYNKTVGSSGITTWPEEKYYDNYTSTTATSACSSGICYGHALSETAGWYKNGSTLVNSTYPWAIRGGCYSMPGESGVFFFNSNSGGNTIYNSFRVVIVGV